MADAPLFDRLNDHLGLLAVALTTLGVLGLSDFGSRSSTRPAVEERAGGTASLSPPGEAGSPLGIRVAPDAGNAFPIDPDVRAALDGAAATVVRLVDLTRTATDRASATVARVMTGLPPTPATDLSLAVCGPMAGRTAVEMSCLAGAGR